MATFFKRPSRGILSISKTGVDDLEVFFVVRSAQYGSRGSADRTRIRVIRPQS